MIHTMSREYQDSSNQHQDVKYQMLVLLFQSCPNLVFGQESLHTDMKFMLYLLMIVL